MYQILQSLFPNSQVHTHVPQAYKCHMFSPPQASNLSSTWFQLSLTILPKQNNKNNLLKQIWIKIPPYFFFFFHSKTKININNQKNKKLTLYLNNKEPLFIWVVLYLIGNVGPKTARNEELWSASFLVRGRLGLGPVKELLLLGTLVINGKHNLPCVANLVAVCDHWLITWGNLSSLLQYNGVGILSTRHKLGSIAHIPSHHSHFPNQNPTLQIQQNPIKNL